MCRSCCQQQWLPCRVCDRKEVVLSGCEQSACGTGEHCDVGRVASLISQPTPGYEKYDPLVLILALSIRALSMGGRAAEGEGGGRRGRREMREEEGRKKREEEERRSESRSRESSEQRELRERETECMSSSEANRPHSSPRHRSTWLPLSWAAGFSTLLLATRVVVHLLLGTG